MNTKRLVLVVGGAMSLLAVVASAIQTEKITKGAKKAVALHLSSLAMATLFSFVASKMQTNKIIKELRNKHRR